MNVFVAACSLLDDVAGAILFHLLDVFVQNDLVEALESFQISHLLYHPHPYLIISNVSPQLAYFSSHFYSVKPNPKIKYHQKLKAKESKSIENDHFQPQFINIMRMCGTDLRTRRKQGSKSDIQSQTSYFKTT